MDKWYNVDTIKKGVLAMAMEKTCCICGKPIKDWGNDPWPVVKDEGSECCDECNMLYVVPARLMKLREVDED